VATEGARREFTLAKPTDEISVLDVVEVIDGDKQLIACREICTRYAVFNAGASAWATKGVRA